MHQHYTWPKMKEQFKQYIKHCDACQHGKRGSRQYSKAPVIDVETASWKDVAVDFSGAWEATINNIEVAFHTFMIIDVFTCPYLNDY